MKGEAMHFGGQRPPPDSKVVLGDGRLPAGALAANISGPCGGWLYGYPTSLVHAGSGTEAATVAGRGNYFRSVNIKWLITSPAVAQGFAVRRDRRSDPGTTWGSVALKIAWASFGNFVAQAWAAAGSALAAVVRMPAGGISATASAAAQPMTERTIMAFFLETVPSADPRQVHRTAAVRDATHLHHTRLRHRRASPAGRIGDEYDQPDRCETCLACRARYFDGDFAPGLGPSACGLRKVEVLGASFLSAFGFLASRLPRCLLPLAMIVHPYCGAAGRYRLKVLQCGSLLCRRRG
jgi:hypothetical protein